MKFAGPLEEDLDTIEYMRGVWGCDGDERIDISAKVVGRINNKIRYACTIACQATHEAGRRRSKELIRYFLKASVKVFRVRNVFLEFTTRLRRISTAARTSLKIKHA